MVTIIASLILWNIILTVCILKIAKDVGWWKNFDSIKKERRYRNV